MQNYLKINNELFENFIKQSPAAVFLVNSAGNFSFVNSAGEKLTGYTQRELLTMNFLQLLPERVGAIAIKKLALLKKQGSFHITGKLITKAQAAVSVIIDAGIVEDDSYLFYCTDITEPQMRLQTEKFLMESELRYRSIFNNSHAPMLVIDPETLIIFDANQAAVDFYGWNLEQLTHKHICEINQRPQELLCQDIQKVVTNQQNNFEFTHKIADGSLRDVEVVSGSVTIQGKDYLHSIIHDTTEKKRYKDDLLQSKITYRGILNSISEMVYIQDENGRFLFINETVEKTYGYPREEFIGNTPDFLSAPGMNDMSVAENAARLAFNGTPQTFEFWGITRSGKVFPKEVCMSQGTYFGKKAVITVARDISERKKAETEKIEVQKKLLHSQKLESIGVLAGGIAHDFNNLLAAILGNLEYLFFKEIEDPEILHHISNAKEGVSKAALLTRQLLAYSGKSSYDIKKLDINALIKGNLELFRTIIGKNINFQTDLSNDLNTVNGDESQLQQVVMNLLTNASEAIGKEAGTIRLITGREYLDDAALRLNRLPQNPACGNFTFIQISDTGCGMTESVLERIFEPFFTTKFTGRGLGMASMLGIIEAHKGALFINSEPGRGSSFKVLLPSLQIGEKKKNGPVKKERYLNKIPKFKGTLIMADDEDMVLLIGSEIVEKFGFKVLKAGNGQAALDLFKAHAGRIDGVLLDMTMPVMDGPTAAKAIREIDASIPILIISGFDGSDQSIDLASIKHNGFIHKPFRIEELSDALNLVFGKDQLTVSS